MVRTIDSERLGTQRREEEGGQIIEDSDASPDPTSVRSPAPIVVRRHATTSLHWDERFVIQPLRPGIGTILSSEKHAGSMYRPAGSEEEKT